jgi:signal transduction histidine kinase
MSGPRTLRGRFTVVGFAIAALTIALLTVAFNLALGSSADRDAKGRLRAEAAAAATTISVRDGRIVPRESPGDAAIDRQVWIYAGARAVERPVADQEMQRNADALAGESRVFRDLPAREYRLYAQPIVSEGRRLGTIVAGLSLAGYDRTTDAALVASLALAAVLLAGVTALTWIVVGRALSRVREMTRAAASWSAHGDAQRFGVSPRPDELGELAETFDALLDRVAASLRHEQRLSAELSHELRTPLARITAGIELLQRRERGAQERADGYASISRSAQQMDEILETLMAAARADAGLDTGHCDVGALVDDLARRWPEGDRPLEARVAAGPVIAGVEREVLERILAPLLENARRYARTRVDLSAAPAGGRVLVTVADDGPGVPDDALAQIFEPGGRSAPDDGHAGAGLGLALARRLARAAGGDVRAERGPAGGAAFRVELPASPDR